MKYFFYILRSQVTEEFYLGQTSNLEDRMLRHNNKRSKYTKRGAPWILVYFEIFHSRKDAVNRERFLKSAQGWQTLQKIKQNLARNIAQLVPKGSKLHENQDFRYCHSQESGNPDHIRRV